MNIDSRRALGALPRRCWPGCAALRGASAQSGNPIKVGMSLALTGAGAPAGKMLQAAIEIWRDDVNAKGGLLGRPVEVIVYDDQSNPAERARPLHQADHASTKPTCCSAPTAPTSSRRRCRRSSRTRR